MLFINFEITSYTSASDARRAFSFAAFSTGELSLPAEVFEYNTVFVSKASLKYKSFIQSYLKPSSSSVFINCVLHSIITKAFPSIGEDGSRETIITPFSEKIEFILGVFISSDLIKYAIFENNSFSPY